LVCDPNLASTEAEARNTLKAQFPPRNTDITTEEFLTAFKRVLKLVGTGWSFSVHASSFSTRFSSTSATRTTAQCSSPR
jgi:hypothetical protein